MPSKRISIDYNNMIADYVGKDGFTSADFEAIRSRADMAVTGMKENRGKMRWRELAYNQEEIARDISDTASSIRNDFDDFVVLGIGGSALGPIAVHQALRHLRYNDLPKDVRKGPRLFVEDNVDPERMQALLDVVNPEKTMFNVITKSGSTSETMAQLLIISAILKKKLGEGWINNVIATTDTNKGNLIKIAKQFNLKTFFVPDGVGGRFSELCPVGLLAAAVTGIDIFALLEGAKSMDKICDEPDIFKNPAYMLAVLQVMSMEKGKNINVLMPYADSLKYFSDWYAQLWAESLGKKYDKSGNIVHTGQTPVKALGVTDQHSQVQLYTEGPYDKVVTFLGVEQYASEYVIDKGFEDIDDVAFLGGHTLNELIISEQRATEYALTQAGRLNLTITLDRVDAFSIGQLICLFEIQTAFAGELLGIDAFDQPGVEAGKNATYALLGKKGFDDKRKELAEAPKKSRQYIIEL